jgi:hypothetical protein
MHDEGSDAASPRALFIDNLTQAKITYPRSTANEYLISLTTYDGRLIWKRVTQSNSVTSMEDGGDFKAMRYWTATWASLLVAIHTPNKR